MDCLAVFCVSVGIQLFAAFAGKYFYPHADERERAVFRYGTIASNATFLGYPVVMGLYGSRGLLYASIYLIPQRIVTWSAGVSCFTDAKGKSAFGSILTHPCIVSVGIGLVLMISQVQLPAALLKTLGYASDCNTALSMLIIGNILAEVKFREIVSKKNLWFCTVRLLVFPGLVYVCCRLLGLDGLVTGVSTVLAGMPAAATTAILAAKYDGDSKLAVKVVSLSTLLSLFTLPLFCLLMAAG